MVVATCAYVRRIVVELGSGQHVLWSGNIWLHVGVNICLPLAGPPVVARFAQAYPEAAYARPHVGALRHRVGSLWVRPG